jgi:hypothetical protein
MVQGTGDLQQFFYVAVNKKEGHFRAVNQNEIEDNNSVNGNVLLYDDMRSFYRLWSAITLQFALSIRSAGSIYPALRCGIVLHRCVRIKDPMIPPAMPGLTGEEKGCKNGTDTNGNKPGCTTGESTQINIG